MKKLISMFFKKIIIRIKIVVKINNKKQAVFTPYTGFTEWLEFSDYRVAFTLQRPFV